MKTLVVNPPASQPPGFGWGQSGTGPKKQTPTNPIHKMKMYTTPGLQALLAVLLTQLVSGGVMISEGKWEEKAKSCDAIVIADVSSFDSKSKVVKVDQKDGAEWTNTQITMTYGFKTLEIIKGPIEKGKQLKAAFSWVSASARQLPLKNVPKDEGVQFYSGPMSVSQFVPGSGLEEQAREGKWIFFLKKAEDGYQVERVENITLLAEVKKLLLPKP